MREQILAYLKRTLEIPNWDRTPAISDSVLEKMIQYLKQKE